MFPELLPSRLAGILELSSEQIAALQAHWELLLRWNKVLNLTRIESLEEAVERHYCESLFLAAHLPIGNLRIADIGSGPGFPGFPVAVVRPDCEITLIESHQRKAVFLREAARNQSNVRVVPKRAEAVKDHFDVVISRAVSYQDLTPTLKCLAETAVLLTGEEEPPVAWEWRWDAILLPWGNSRYLRSGRIQSGFLRSF